MNLAATADIALVAFPVVVTLLIAMIGVVYSNIKKQIEDGEAARKKEVADEGLARSAAVSAIRNDLAREISRLESNFKESEKRVNDLQREIDRDMINDTRLEKALRPIQESQQELKDLIHNVQEKVDKIRDRSQED